MKSTETVAVRKLDLVSRRDETTTEGAAVELPINIYVNSKLAATLFATPTSQSELAIGYLVGEGILRTYSDIQTVSCSEETTSVHVRTKPGTRVRIRAARVVRVLTSACGSSEDFHRLLDRIEKPLVRADQQVSASEVTRMMRVFNEHSEKFREIGGFQYAAAFFEGQMNAFFEDVGMDNAVAKALGAVMKAGLDPSRTVLVTSGRLSGAEAIKAARVGVPIILSMREPTYSGVRVAQKTGVTLCCSVRGPRMNIYSGFDRIIVDP